MNPVLIIVSLILVAIVFISFYRIIKHGTVFKTKRNLSLAFLLAFVFQLLFAFYSVGNAEFMVMLPALMLLWILLNFNIPTQPVMFFSLALLCWNILFGLAPHRYLDLDGSQQLVIKINKYPDSKWVLNEPQKIENMLDYKVRFSSEMKVIRLNNIESDMKKCADFARRGRLFTDKLNVKSNLGRLSLLHQSYYFDKLTKKMNCQVIDSIEFFGNKKLIHELKIRD